VHIVIEALHLQQQLLIELGIQYLERL